MILITNATAVEFDPPRVRHDVEILIDGREIVAVSEGGRALTEATPGASGAGAEYTVIDAAGALVYPGLVCSHHHIYSGLARGIIAEIGPTPDFASILRNLWWRLDQAANEESMYASGLVCSLDAIRAGTTALIDHHASPRFIRGSLATLKRAFEYVGIRGATCYEVTDRHGREGMLAGVEENAAFARALDAEQAAGTHRGLVQSHIGGHAPFTLPEEGLEALAEVVKATGRGFHVHVAEDRYDASFSHATYGEDLIARLDRHGLVNERTMIAHGIFLHPHEIDLVNERDAFLLHNCRSNMNNGVGYNHHLAEYTNLALGTDGIGGDMLAEFKHAYFKHRDDNGPMGPDGYLRALAAGNRILERTFGGRFGRLEPGYAADVVINDYDPPTPLVAHNLAGHLAFGLDASGTRTVIVGGDVVYRDGAFPFDTASILADARVQATALWERMNAIAP